MHRRSLLALLTTLPFATGCRETASSAREPSPTASGARPHRLASVLIEGVPHVQQKPDFCGEAVAAAYLEKLGKPYDQDHVFALSGMDPSRGMGATTRELAHALQQIGFDTGPVWHQVNAATAGEELAVLFEQLHADLVGGVPSIVCMHYDDAPNTTEHFRLVLGYDHATDEVVYHEPAEGDGDYRRMPRSRLLALWPLRYAPDRYTVVRLRLRPTTLRDPPSFDGHSPADYAQHVHALKKRIAPHFTVKVQEPFVVVGDEDAPTVIKRAHGTVRWAVEQLKAAYFDRDPKHILDVFLFRDESSYRKHALALFGTRPDTPYGYYASDDRALVMNIATGGGTLVHEIVHPFIEANFPRCPSWFNEGLGSLYEQSGEREGRIVGLTNWRLAGLQRAIRRGNVPSFETLTHTSRRAFYDHDPGTNYAQARYLLYYLQERGVLRAYYHAFRAAHTADPTGFATLKKVLKRDDMVAFKADWERFVLGLRFG